MLWAIVLYSAGLAGLGLWLSRRVRGAGDFFVASRQLSPGLVFATFLAANLGAGTTVGAAELGYRHGLSAWWWVGSAGLGSLALAFFIGPRIYRLAGRFSLYTVGDYLELRYNRAARLATASALWLGSLAILAGQLIAMGLVLEVVAGLPSAWGVALGGAVTTCYFVGGGLWGSAWVNVVQVVVKGFGFCLATPWALSLAGGFGGIERSVEALADRPEAYLSFTGVGVEGVARFAVILIPSFFVSPGLIQKLFGARDERAVRTGVGAQGVTLCFYAFLPALLGMTAFVLHPDLPDPGLALPTLLAEDLPPAVGGLMLAASFSAEVSSADAVLFMLSTSVARDLAPAALGRPLSDAELLRTSRIAAATAGVIGILLAIQLQSVIAALVVFYTLLTVTLFAPLLGGLYWRRAGSASALAATAVGVPATLAAHWATAGAGWGLATPAAVGIAASAATFTAMTLLRPCRVESPADRPAELP